MVEGRRDNSFRNGGTLVQTINLSADSKRGGGVRVPPGGAA
jgi:hypothetical protein